MTAARRRLNPVSDNPARVALYVRVSALMGRGGDEFHSPSVQLSAMQRVTAGLRQVAIIEDLDRTGRHFNREGIDKIRGMAERGEIDALAVYDVSRLGRNVRESLGFLAELADRGVTILSACEQVDTSTPAGRLMLTNMLAIAEYRSDEIARSWSAAIGRRAEQGKHHGRPLGYLKQDKKLVVDPVLGPVIAKAWRDYAAGVTISQICRDLSEARGCPVHAGNTKNIFRRQVYLGHVTASGQVVSTDAHPALIDVDIWEAVQLRLARDAKTPSRNLEVTWALVGLSFCPCGARLQRQPRWRKGIHEQRLCCGQGPSRGMAGGCEGIGFPLMTAVESEVLRQVEAYIVLLRTDDAARAEQLVRRHTAMADATALRRRLGQVQDAVARLAKAWALGELTDDEYHRPAAELKAEADTLRARLADVGDAQSRPSPEQAATAAAALLQMWPRMNVAQRNRALRVLVARITVRRSVRWREPEADRVRVKWV